MNIKTWVFNTYLMGYFFKVLIIVSALTLSGCDQATKLPAPNNNANNDASSLFFFSGYQSVTGPGVWATDGTKEGTKLIKAIFDPYDSLPSAFTHAGKLVYFTAYDGTSGQGIWKSDSTEAGTTLVKGNASDFGEFWFADDFKNLNSSIYFSAEYTDFDAGSKLWTSDGTALGTKQIENSDMEPSRLSSMASFNNALYFGAYDSTAGTALWRTDVAGTHTELVKVINPSRTIYELTQLTVVNSTLYFIASTSTSVYQLWKSDGTEVGTTLVKTLAPKHVSSPSPQPLTSMNGTLYFVASDAAGHQKLWKSDGTEAGTVIVKEAIRLGVANSQTTDLVVFENRLYFSAKEPDYDYGYEPWSSDGTEAGTTMLKDIYAGLGLNSSAPRNFVVANGLLFFTAYSENNNLGLWKTDGTASGTQLLEDITQNSGSMFYPGPIGIFQDRLYFYDGNDELWKTDGTKTGTILMKGKQ